MKTIRFKCDGCGKEAEVITVKLPIQARSLAGIRLVLHDIDLCQACANEISDAYYGIAKRHNNSGLIAIDMTEE